MHVTHAELPVIGVEPALFRQVLINLIENAVKYVDPDVHPCVHVSAQRDRATGQIILRVADNGIGIPEAAKEKVFAAFHRQATTYPGTGMGLAICRRIIERHGGEVRAEDNEGGGTVMSVSLPDDATGNHQSVT